MTFGQNYTGALLDVLADFGCPSHACATALAFSVSPPPVLCVHLRRPPPSSRPSLLVAAELVCYLSCICRLGLI